MNSIPIPFVVVFMLVLLTIVFHRPLHATATGTAFAQVLYLLAASTFIIGLRWSFGWVGLMPVAVILTVLGTSLMYLAFRSLERSGPVIVYERDWVHLLPLLAIFIALLLSHSLVDFVLVAIQLAYVFLLAKLALRIPAMPLVRIDWIKNTQMALWGAVAVLVFSALVDLAIAVDFYLYEGRHSENFVGTANFTIIGRRPKPTSANRSTLRRFGVELTEAGQKGRRALAWCVKSGKRCDRSERLSMGQSSSNQCSLRTPTKS